MKEEITIKLAEDNQFGRAGQLVTLSLTPDDVHDPTELPTYLAGFKPFGFRADEASPVILVDHDKDKFRQFNSDDAFRQVDVKGSIEGSVPEVDPKSALSTYTVVDRFVGSFINSITEQNATGAYRPRQAAMKRCQRAIQLDREVDVWTLLGTLGSWATGNRTTLAATFNWNGGSASDPVLDLQTRIEASAQQVTDIWMNQQVANAFLRHASVRNHMKQFLGDSTINAAIGMVNNVGRQSVDFAIPGLPPIHVAAAKKKNESSGALDYVLADDVVLLCIPPGVPTDGEDISSTYTFRRKGGAGVGYETREYRVEGRGPKGGTMVVVSMADIAIMTANTAGGLIKDIIQ